MTDTRLARQCAALYLVAAAASVLSVASGYVIFEHESLASGWWMVRRLKWFVLGAAVAGLGIGFWTTRFNQLWLSAPGEQELQARVVGLGILRLFVHFVFHGFMVMLATMAAFGAQFLGWLARLLRLAERDDAAPKPSGNQRLWQWLFMPLWFLVGPLGALHEEELPTLPPPERLQRSMERWFPVLCFGLAFATQFVNEETGDPTDPRWLVCLGTLWLGDYLGLWWLLRAKAKLPGAA